MEKATKPLGINIISLNDLRCEIPPVNETGKTPLENARIKAETYYDAFQSKEVSTAMEEGFKLFFSKIMEG